MQQIKFKNFLDNHVAGENAELCRVFSKAYDVLSSTGDVVKTVPVLHVGSKQICPHCDEEIGEKELYYDGTNWFHRPCMEAGPIIFADNESDIYAGIAEIASGMDCEFMKPQKTSYYTGDSSIPDKIEYQFESGSGSSKCEYTVPSIKGGKPVKTCVAPGDRSFDNIPKYSDGKTKVKFQDWLELEQVSNSVGKSPNGKWYGWSHRAQYGFGIGDKVTKGDANYRGKEYTIKTDAQAKEAATNFAEDVS